MSKKVNIDVESIVYNFNEGGSTLSDLAVGFNVSVRTLTRKLKDNGYIFDRAINKYILQDNVLRETISKESLSNDDNGVTIKNVNRTYLIPENLDRALKIKASVEGTNVNDIIVDVLMANIEDMYFVDNFKHLLKNSIKSKND